MQGGARVHPVEELLAESRWLNALARRLTGDAAEADDLVQEVWSTALARPRALRDPRGWLARVLRSRWLAARRSEGARRERERGVAGEGHEDPAEVVARAEAQRRLVEAVLELDEPQRATLLWHYFDGESLEAIAARTRTPASTVRARLAQALARLRQRLERRDGHDWLAALAPLAGATPGGLVAAGTATTIGGAVMIWKLTAVAVMVLGALIWWKVDVARPEIGLQGEPLANAPVGGAPVAAAEPRAASRAGATELAASEERSVAAPPAAQPAPIEPPASVASAAAALPDGVLEGLVLVDEQPYRQGGEVALAPGGAGSFPASPDPATLRVAALGGDGTFRFEGLEATGFVLRATLRSGATTEAFVALRRDEGSAGPSAPVARGTAGGTAGPLPPRRERQQGPVRGRHVVLRLGTAALFGNVYEVDGSPSAGARVEIAVAPWKDEQLESLAVAVCGADGGYRIEHQPAGLVRGTVVRLPRAGGEPVDEHFSVTLAAGAPQRLDFGSAGGLPRWTGSVRTQTGSLVEAPGALLLHPADGSGLLPPQPLAGGRFEVRAPPGRYRVSLRQDHEFSRHHALGEVELGAEDREQDLLLAGARVRGTLRHPDGRVPELGGARALRVDLVPEGRSDRSAHRLVSPDERGRYAIDGLEPGVYLLRSWPTEPVGGETRVELRPGDVELIVDLIVSAP